MGAPYAPHCVYVQHADTVLAGNRKQVRQSNTVSFDSDYIQNVSFDGAIEGGRLQVLQDLAQDVAGVGKMTRFSFRR